MNLDVTKSTRPAVVRLAGKAIQLGATLGITKLRLDSQRLRTEAERRTGLTTWDPDPMMDEGLDRLLWSLNNESRMDAFGRFLAGSDVLDWLAARLRYNDARARHAPATGAPGAGEVDEALFIIGFPRTGSTLLHNLLACDERFRAPRLWELLNPVPYPRVATYESDPRIAETERKLRLLDRLSPLARKIHPMEARLPDECHYLMDSDFVGPHYCLYFDVPTYWQWVKRCDDAIVESLFRRYREKVAYLCTEKKGVWLSKSAVHLYFVPVLAAVFPKAHVVRLRRKPAESVASTASLIASYRMIYADRVDTVEVGRAVLDLYNEGMARMADAEATLGAERAIDVDYEALVADPVATCSAIYRRFGYPVTEELRTAWRTYLDANRKDRHGRHVYALESFALSEERIRDSATAYRRHQDDAPLAAHYG